MSHYTCFLNDYSKLYIPQGIYNFAITYLVLSKILRQLPSEMALVLCPRVKVLLHFREVPSKYELIYWSVLPCANFFIFYIYYLHMWSSCVMTFLVKRKISETCTAKIIFEEILHGQTYLFKYVITPLHFSFQQFITIWKQFWHITNIIVARINGPSIRTV